MSAAYLETKNEFEYMFVQDNRELLKKVVDIKY